MARQTPASSRSWPIPPESATVHLVGDMHFGGITQARRDIVLADVKNNPMMPNVGCHVQVGDLVNDALTSQDATALAWMNQLPHPWYAAVGNHDIWGNVRTPDQAATAHGMPAANYVVDLGFAKLIVVSPDNLPADNTTIILSTTTINWLNTQLVGAGKPCLITCHAPLKDTVTLPFDTGSVPQWYVNAAADVTQCLADNPNAKAWLSGHTHNHMHDPNIVKAMTFGSHQLAAINASALHYTGSTLDWFDPLRSVYVTLTDTQIDVRFRDHGAGIWHAPINQRVRTVTL